MKKMFLIILLCGAFDVSAMRVEDFRGQVLRPIPQRPQSIVPKKTKRHELRRSQSAPLDPIAEEYVSAEQSMLPGSVPERPVVPSRSSSRVSSRTVTFEEVKTHIDHITQALHEFQQDLKMDGNGKAHSFVLPDEITLETMTLLFQVPGYLGSVKEIQDTCLRMNKKVPAWCTDQVIFTTVEQYLVVLRQHLDRLSEDRPGAKKKILATVLAQIDALSAGMRALDVYVNELHRRYECCQQLLTKKSWWCRWFGCFSKKQPVEE